MATSDPLLEAALAERERRQSAGEWQEDSITAPPATVAAGQSTKFANTMTNAESAYQRAIEQGYDPTTLKNSAASAIEGIPLVGGALRPVGQFFRDDVGDRGRQAELNWTDAELRAASGAAAPEPEVARKAATFFPGGGQKLGEIEGQMRAARKQEFESEAIRSGVIDPRKAYGQVHDIQPQSYWDALPPKLLKAARLYSGSKAPSGTKGNPTVAPNQAAYDDLPVGVVFLDPDGHKWQKANGTDIDLEPQRKRAR